MLTIQRGKRKNGNIKHLRTNLTMRYIFFNHCLGKVDPHLQTIMRRRKKGNKLNNVVSNEAKKSPIRSST